MKKLTMCFLILIYVVQPASFYAQTNQMSTPQFTLTLFENHDIGPGFNRVTVKMTNTSNDIVLEPGCVKKQDIFIFSVLYNGRPLKKNDEKMRHRRETMSSQFCGPSKTYGIDGIKPGESVFYWFPIAVDYEVSKPGIYEVNVSTETIVVDIVPFTAKPSKRVTVKSNTLTIVVPEL